jgi:TonB family protein
LLPFPIRALSGSLLVHGALLLWLLSLSFSAALPVSSIRTQVVILTAPSVSRQAALPLRPRQGLTPPRTTLKIVPRAFHAPEVASSRPAPRPLISALEPLRLDVAQLAPELPRSSVTFAPPPLKTNNLAEDRPAVPNPAPRQLVQTAGFSQLETSAPVLPHRAPSGAGGFDAATPAELATPRAVPHASIPARGGFGDATAGAATPQSRATAPVSPLIPVEILFKPRPAYTEDARRLQIEGEVLLEMLFVASGEARVERIVRGLGHGLDESAVAAARGIRFHPARRDGMPVDFQATVHIVFELAY